MCLLPLGLDLILQALLLGFLEIPGRIDFIIFLHLCLHYLLVVAFLWQYGGLHGGGVASSFGLRTLTEEVLAFWGEETTSSKAPLMILVLTVDDPFAFEQFLLCGELAQHASARAATTSLVLCLLNQLLHVRNAR